MFDIGPPPKIIVPQRPAIVRAASLKDIELAVFPFPFHGRGRWETAFSYTAFDFDASGQENASYRQVVPAIPVSGSKIRVTFRASSTATTTFDNMSVGIRSGSTDDCTGTPVELKVSGASGLSLSSGASVVSDELSFTTVAGQDLLIVMDIAASNGTGRAKSTDPGGGITTYRQLSANTYNTATMTGTANVFYVYSVEKVEIWVG